MKSIICRLLGHKPIQIPDLEWIGKRAEQQEGHVECDRCGERLPDGFEGVYRPVLMPKMAVDYWRRNSLINEVVATSCDFCDRDIEAGGHYFLITAHTWVTQEGETINEVELKGHLQHLVYAPRMEWVPREEDQDSTGSEP